MDKIDKKLDEIYEDIDEKGWLEHLIRYVEREIRKQAHEDFKDAKSEYEKTQSVLTERQKADWDKRLRNCYNRKFFIVSKLPFSMPLWKAHVYFYNGAAQICHAEYERKKRTPEQEKHDWNSVRFAIAHEVAHILFHSRPLDKDYNNVYYPGKRLSDPKELEKMEAEANFFAKDYMLRNAERFRESLRDLYNVDSSFVDGLVAEIKEKNAWSGEYEKE